jgi:signal transduction histidine kinase/ActR/RegA family two-component response regulator
VTPLSFAHEGWRGKVVVFGRLFDERFADVAAGVLAYAPVRLTMCACVFAFVGLGAGWVPAIVWAAAALLAEAAMLMVVRHIVRYGVGGSAWACMTVYALAVPTWSMAGVLLWGAPDPACQVAGAAFFAGHLLYIQAHHAHSPGAALPVLPAVLLPAIVPLAIPQFTGAGQAIVCLAMAAVVLHALISLWVSLKKSRDLMEAQAAMRSASLAKSEFLARMSHEIRTPLNGVLGMAQALAAEPDLTGRHRKSLDVIRQSGESLLSILNDILDLSKVEAGRLDLEAIPFDLEDAVHGAQATFAPQAEAKGLAFRLAVDPAAAGTYLGDPTRLRQILYNLLSNAVKFTQAGEVSLSVARVADALTLVVADTGIGIAEADRGRLFSRFEQVDSSTTRRYGGTGLGLSICRELAELMGGSIEVESLPRAGSRFIVVLPLPRLGDREASRGISADTLEAGLGAEGVALRVLAAEDNPINQLVLTTLLAQVGLEPDMVADGQAAVDAWRTGAYDLILMDIQMPVLDGPSALAQIRSEEFRTGRRRTPVLALTANAMQHQVEEYLTRGFDGHVAKPIDAGRLYEAIAEAAARRPGGEGAAAAAG